VREWVIWFGAGRLAATALSVIAVVAGGAWLLHGSPSPPESSLPYAARNTPTTSASAPSSVAVSTSIATQVVVYVAGRVVVPGVYTLPVPARVDDAVRAAGGPAADADLDVVNLAAVVHDGERVFVPAVGQSIPDVVGVTSSAGSTAPTFPININTADGDQLDELPGVGPATAAAIIARRQEHGPFQSVDELGDVRGIGPAKLDAIRGLVTV
jgi:competence protein ComEA